MPFFRPLSTQTHVFIQLIIGDNKVEFDVIFGRSEDENKALMENLQCLINNLDGIVPYGFPNITKMQIRALSVPSCSFYGKVKHKKRRFTWLFRIRSKRHYLE